MRGRFGGPFQLLIRAPEICEHAAKLGEHLRWGTSLPDRLSELAIIVTARFWRAQYEWYAHAPLAARSRRYRPPRSRRSAPAGPRSSPPVDEALGHYRHVCSRDLPHPAAYRTQSFTEAVAAFGEQGLVEVIGIIGYYTLIGNTLNVFQVGLREERGRRRLPE